MAERVDLDENLANVRRMDDLRMAEIKRLNAALRVAREVVEAARWMHDEHKLRVGPDGYHDCVLCGALAAYGRHAEEGGADG